MTGAAPGEGSGRVRLAALVVVLLAGVFAFGAGEARADTVSTTCPPPGGRQLCLTIEDTEGVSASTTGRPRNNMRYVVTVTNVGGSSLTNATVKTVLSDLPLTSSGGTTASLVTLSTTPASATCTEPAPGQVTCAAGRLAAGASFTLKLGYATSFVDGVTGARLEATASVNEHDQDQGDGDPNPEIDSISNDTTYESDPTKGFSFVPNKPGTKIDVTTSRSSLSFTTPGFEEFFALIQDFANDTSHCFTGVTCLPGATFGDVTNTLSGVGPFLWQTRLTTTTNAANIDGVHTLDPVSVSVNPANDTFSAGVSFAGYDGVRFSSSGTLPGGLLAGTDYFAVSVSANGTTFKVSTKKGGKAVDITSAGTGQLQAERVEVIGDVKSERVTSCAATLSKVPSIFAFQVDPNTVDTCVSTRENGWMKH